MTLLTRYYYTLLSLQTWKQNEIYKSDLITKKKFYLQSHWLFESKKYFL